MNKKITAALAISMALMLTFGAGALMSDAGAAAPPVPSGSDAAGHSPQPAVWDLGQVFRWTIAVESEHVIVRRGGMSFQIEVSAESRDSYELEDGMHKITARYQEREIVFQRKDGAGADAVYSPTITITVPEHTENALYSITTTTGDISIDHSHADKILAESDSGIITISNSFAVDYIIAESADGVVSLTDTTCDGPIYTTDKDTPDEDTPDEDTPQALCCGESHLSQSGYSEAEFAALLNAAELAAASFAKAERLGTPQYAGELFDLDAVKGTVTFHFDLGGKYETLAVDMNACREVIGYKYW